MNHDDADERTEINGMDIAIIGMTGRFPGAPTIDEYWHNLREGVESVSFFTDEELIAAGVSQTELRHPNYVKATANLRDVDLFDANFFGFSPRDAELTDPQQRLFIECAWEALESAGYNPEIYDGAIGVYAGSGINTYLLNNILTNPDLAGSLNPYQFVIHNDKDFLSTRVSYKLNLKGPSIVVQTACSTSLVAVHLACQSLLSYQCDMALAGGVTIRVPQIKGYVYQESGVASPDGHCRAFDEQAQGTIGGNGVGIVVLKRLEDAIADGDNICALIKGSAINNDGAQKVGFTAPSIDGQAEVIETAQTMAGIDPESLSYIETHGTGTAMGDPIEVAALTQAFRTRTQKTGFCAIGSVKTNIGHLDTAAGVAGLIKTVLSLQHGLLPPSLHFNSPNPAIDFAASPFYVNSAASEWKANGAPRRAAVSSFGMGGTNAHVILEAAPAAQTSEHARPSQLLAISARTETALEAATANLTHHLEQQPDINLADVAYTLHLGRKAFNHRRILVCRDAREAADMLAAQRGRQSFTSVCAEKSPEVVFMFPGQGAQYVNMGRELYETEAVFRHEVDACAELLKPELNFDLRDVLYPVSAELEEATRKIKQTLVTQATLFVIEYATAKLWMSWGVRPKAMVGHSLGEYVAACLAEVFTLEEALRLVALRGRLMQQMPSGLMLAVPRAVDEVRPLLCEGLSLAAINAPTHCVVSGDAQAVERFERQMLERGINCRRLQTSHAFHSEMMQPVMPTLIAAARVIRLRPPRIPYLSNLTGTWIKAEEATNPDYWAQHLRQTVRFSENMQELLQQQNLVLLEVGPGQTLSTLARQHFATADEGLALTSLRHPQQEVSDIAALLETLGKLWLAGVTVDWQSFYDEQQRRRVVLPTYPFERQRYWIAPAENAGATPVRSSTLQRNPNVEEWFYLPVWKQAMPHAIPDTVEPQRWLVFLDSCDVGQQLARRLRQQGLEVLTVQSGAGFRQHDEQAYEIDPRQRGDYETLFRELGARDKFPHGIAHCWAITGNAGQELGAREFAEMQDAGFNSLLYLTQSLETLKLNAPLRLCALSNDMQMVTGEESLRPEKATLLGLCKVIPQEYPHINCRSIDVSLRLVAEAQRDRFYGYLAGELLAQTSETVVAYRGVQRWTQSFDAARLDNKTGGVGLRQEGVYLITGGLGSIGLLLAEYLAQTVRAKLVLVGRSALPAREDWEQWLATTPANESVSQKLRAFKALEAFGAEVMFAQADVADKEQMQSVMRAARERFGEFDGVIHAAGLVGETWLRSIRETDQQLIEAHFRPKAHGLIVLGELLKGKKLDFCLLISSLSSILGGLEYAAYAAANSFMDALAHRRQLTDGVSWMSVNWDGWQAQPDAEAESAAPSRLGILGREGVRAFAALLPFAAFAPQLVISTGDLNARFNQLSKRERASAIKKAAGHEETAAYPRTGMQHQYEAPSSELEHSIAHVWKDALGLQQVGIHDSFFELGGDSLLATQILPRLRESLEVDLSLRNFFEVPTVAGLAGLITRLRQEQKDAQEEEILKMLDSLSEEELEAELNKRMQIAES